LETNGGKTGSAASILGIERVGIVIVSVLVLVALLALRLGLNLGHDRAILINLHDSLNRVQGFRCSVPVPDVQFVPPGRNLRDSGMSRRIADRVEIRIDRNDDGRHIGVDVAEKVRNASLIELDRTLGARLVQSEIESFASELRKYVVEPGIKIGEIDGTALWNHKEIRMEHLVALDDTKMLLGRNWRSWRVKRCKPKDHLTCILCSSSGADRGNLRLKIDGEFFSSLGTQGGPCIRCQ